MRKLTIAIILLVIGLNFMCKQTETSQQYIQIKGKLDGHKFNYTPEAYGAALYVDDLEFQFKKIKIGDISYDEIEINNINKRGLLHVGRFQINQKPQDSSQVDINFNIANACAEIDIPGGTFEITRILKDRIAGQLKMDISENDWVQCEFDLKLYDFIAKLPFPVKSMDGTDLEYKKITDSYPDDSLKYGDLALNGNFKNVEFNTLIKNGHIQMNKASMEIIAYNVDLLNHIEIEMQALPIDEKLRVGSFTLVPMDQQGKIKLANNELFAEWEDSISKDSFDKDYPIQGNFEILAYDSTTIAGAFTFNILDSLMSIGFANGKFKLPVQIIK